MVLLGNQVEPVVALLAVLGIRPAEVPVTDTLVTGGLRGSIPVNVSSRMTTYRYIFSETKNDCYYLSVVFDQ